MVYWLFGAGLILLALGGEGLIRGGVSLTRALGVSPIVVGLFAISIGTASPALAVAVRAAVWNAPDIVLGTVIGATMLNLLLILGLGALIQPMPSAPKVVLRDGGAMLAASIALGALAAQGRIDRRDGVLLLGGFAIYAILAAITDWRRSSEHSVACAEAEKRSFGERPSAGGGFFALLVGAISLVLGAHFAVGGALNLGAAWHVPPFAMAMSVLALGVSLPVLTVTWIAALRGHTQIAIGHLIVTSVFNIFGVLGIAALVHPLTLPPSIAVEGAFAVFGGVALLLLLVSANWRLSRPKGALLALAYAGYLGYTAWSLGLVPHAMFG
jgi:cation:H+ antiporter